MRFIMSAMLLMIPSLLIAGETKEVKLIHAEGLEMKLALEAGTSFKTTIGEKEYQVRQVSNSNSDVWVRMVRQANRNKLTHETDKPTIKVDRVVGFIDGKVFWVLQVYFNGGQPSRPFDK